LVNQRNIPFSFISIDYNVLVLKKRRSDDAPESNMPRTWVLECLDNEWSHVHATAEQLIDQLQYFIHVLNPSMVNYGKP